MEFYRKYKPNLVDFHVAGNNIDRKPYMVTPCEHYFHSTCLESWLKQKQECPCCRKEITEF